ncbi:sorting nexin 2B isoform X2 [Dendrobium catenatum]|uniref:Sorting nexin 2B n=1 Tax=Dendrobium catenatum TaxID=906689 RepID=A0A2I0WUL8_9ASPA|nr:sorting nexin 2B isoform X2 [Dendrobium catenatum]PKU79323.1 Sorting nexin 2B [Dendrobium catenatum]
MMGPGPQPSFASPPLTEAMESLPLSPSSSSNNSSSPSSSSIHRSAVIVDSCSDAKAFFHLLEPQIGQNLPSRSGRASNFEITVSDPQKENAAANSPVPGGGSFISYLITTRTCSGGPGFSVRRRFRDVVTLADHIAESHRGFFIPLRPEKSVVESRVMHKHEFVEHRRAALEKYLQRLAAHPVIGRSEELRVFLLEPGNLPLALTTDMASRILDGALRLPKQLFGDGSNGWVAPQESVLPARGGRYLARMFKELRQSVRNDLVGAKPLVVEEDKAFLEWKGKIQDFALQLNASSDKAEALVKAQQDIAETMGELGLSFVKLVKLENNEIIDMPERSWAVDAKVVATAAVKASRFYRELNAQTIRHLETLQEYTGLMLSIRNAFSERSGALLTVQTLISDLASWHARAEKLEAASARFFSGYDSRIQRLEEIRRTMRITEDAKSCATREYEKIKENNRYDLERFDKDRHDDFLNMLRGLAMNQVEYFQKIADVWERVASETSHYTKDNC